jgi:hypothetical protein
MSEFDFDDLDDLINSVIDGPSELESETPPTVAEVITAAAVANAALSSEVSSIEIDDVEFVLAELAAPTPPKPVAPEATVVEEIAVPEQASTHVFTDVADNTPTVPIPTFTSDDILNSLDIRNFATLVTLNTARWHAKVKDRKAAKDAAEATGADSAAFEARKRLLVGADGLLKDIHRAIDAARGEHYRLTLPWSTVGINDIGKRAGSRMLPNTLFMEYTTAMAKCKMDMDSTLAKFIPMYPQLVSIAQQKLGKSFNPAEYPNPASIASHFDMSFDFNPIPIGADFRGLQDAQAKKLATALDRKTRTMLENAMQEAWTQLYDLVKHAVEKLTSPDALFHYTMVDKLKDRCKVIKHLNVTSDARIEEVRAAVEKELTKHEAADIRKDDALRKRLATAAREIFDRMKQIGGTP